MTQNPPGFGNCLCMLREYPLNLNSGFRNLKALFISEIISKSLADVSIASNLALFSNCARIQKRAYDRQSYAYYQSLWQRYHSPYQRPAGKLASPLFNQWQNF